MRWLRPLLAFTWMDMLGINLGNGSHGISHSMSKMTLCERDHWTCNCRSVEGNLYSPSDADGSWQGSQYYAQTCSQSLEYCCSDKSWGQPGKHVTLSDTFHVQPCPRRSQTFTVLQTLLLRQELGATRKASYAFRHMSCPTLSMTSLTMLLVFDEDFKITHTD